MVKPIITVTDKALERIKFLIEKSDKPILGLRVGVKSGGCAGLSYTVQYSDQQMPFDEVVEIQGIKIVIASDALIHLIGTQMDYVESKFKSGFTFSNPNVKSTCGCGESFNA
jgi:iron-sulfur cluster assembly protein